MPLPRQAASRKDDKKAKGKQDKGKHAACKFDMLNIKEAIASIASDISQELEGERLQFMKTFVATLMSKLVIGIAAQHAKIVDAGSRLPPTHPEAESQLKEWAGQLYGLIGYYMEKGGKAAKECLEWAEGMIKGVMESVLAMLKEQAREWGVDDSSGGMIWFRILPVWFAGRGPHYIIQYKGPERDPIEARILFPEYRDGVTDEGSSASGQASIAHT